jgi:hypothetical protein
MTAALIAGLFLAAAPAQGQPERPERPFRGLFGGLETDPGSRQRLDFAVTLNAGYDDNIIQGLPSEIVDPRVQDSSKYAGLGAALTYRLRAGRRTSFGAGVYSSLRYFADEIAAQPTPNAHSASVDLTTMLGGATLALSQGVSVLPYYSALYNILPAVDAANGMPRQSNLDYGLTEQKALAYSTSAGLSMPVSRRSSLSFSYGRNQADYDSERFDFFSQRAGAAYSHQTTRNLTLRLGYGHEWAKINPDMDLAQTHNLDVGVAYSRALSFSRRTTFSFSTGSSILTFMDTTEPDRQLTYYNLIGQASLNHEIGRSWNARISYDRSVQFVQAFSEPFFGDSVFGELSGQVTRRWDASFRAGYSMGTVGASATGNGYDMLNVGAGTGFAISRYLRLHGNYFYYRYDFEEGVSIPLNLSQGVDRHGFQVGLGVWLPLLR